MAGKNTADIGFEKQIWDAACVLRGNMDASEYKNVVLGLIFLKYISDRFDEKYQALVEEGDGFESFLCQRELVGVKLQQMHIRLKSVQLLMMLCVRLKRKIKD